MKSNRVRFSLNGLYNQKGGSDLDGEEKVLRPDCLHESQDRAAWCFLKGKLTFTSGNTALAIVSSKCKITSK